MIRVLVERRVQEGKIGEYEECARSIQLGAMASEAYLSGEALRDPADPLRYFTLSTWKDVGGWREWVESPSRRGFIAELSSTLAGPEQITIMEHVR